MARLIGSTLSVLALAALGGAVPEEAQGQRGWGNEREGAPGCAIYEHVGFAGEARVFGRDAGTETLGPRWNDRISSLRCRPGCQLTAYEHADGRGAFHLFGGDVRDVGMFWNDKISAVRISCVGPDLPGSWGWGEDTGRDRDRGGRDGWQGRERRAACTYYEHANYAGRREGIRDGEELRSLGGGWNDVISSVSCRPGCELTAYEHSEFRGAVQSYRGETGFVGPQWNDRISALRAQCR